MRYDIPSQRPDEFELDMDNQLAQGLVFAGLGRVAGSTHYRDSSPYGNHGTLTNFGLTGSTGNWVWLPYLGRFGLHCEEGDYVLGHIQSCLGGNFSFASWAYCTTASDETLQTVLSVDRDAGIYRASLAYYYGLGSWSFGLYDGGNNPVANAADSSPGYAGKWVHLAGVRVTGKVWIYVNGVGTSVNDTSGDPGAHGVVGIGDQPSQSPRRFIGYLADGMIWDRAISPAEISALADPSNVMLSGLVLPPRRRLWAVSGGGGGTAFTQTVADALGVTDSPWYAAAYSRTQADALGVTDARVSAATWNRTQGDPLGIVDTPTAARGYGRTQADALGITDAAGKAATFARTVTDAEGITDATASAATFLRAVSDALGIADALVPEVTYARLVADVLGITDTPSLAATYLRTVADSLGITDAMLNGTMYILLIEDALGLTDASASVATYNRTVADSEGLSDAIAKVAVVIRAIADSEGLTDSTLSVLTSTEVTFLAAWYVLLRRLR